MASAALNLPLVAAGAAASNDWASASADTNVTVDVGASLKRGFCVGAGISALATADAGLQKFITLEASGNAFAEAQAAVQLQLTLNAFERLGFIIGAQAKAQAAAGLEVGLGISTGDFIKLIEHNADVVGLPLELVLLLLDETSIEAIVKVHVAASAAAYAQLQATLQLVAQPGGKRGFFYTAKAGVGVAAGVGFGASFGCGLKDPGKFFGRAVDLVVNHVADAIDVQVATSPQHVRDVAFTFRPVAKLALRHAFELGHFLAENKAASVASQTSALAEKSIRVITEEFQQFFFETFLNHAIGTLKDFVTSPASGLTEAVWRRIKPQRLALATALRAAPGEPFVFTPANVTYWAGMIANVVAFADAMAALPHKDDTVRAASILYATTQLLLEINNNRTTRTEAYASAIGAGRVSAPPPALAGKLQPQPARPLRSQINVVLGRAAGTEIRREDLIAFLSGDLLVNPLRQRFPQLDALLRIFKGPLAATENQVLAALIAPQGSGRGSAPEALLAIVLNALDGFIETEIIDSLGGEVAKTTTDATVRLYVHEVVLPTLRFTKDLTLKSVLNWDKHPPNRDDFLELLSAIAVMPVSRSAVVLFDGLLAAVQKEVRTAFTHASTTLDGPKNPFAAVGIRPDPITKQLFTTVLASGGDIFGPLPDEVRTRLRHSMYDVFALLPPGDAEGFLEQLAQDSFVPNLEAVNELKDELLGISVERFGRFVEAMMLAGGAAIDALLEALYAEAVALIARWEQDLAKALDDALAQIAALRAAIDHQVREVQRAFETAMGAFEDVLETLANDAARRTLKDGFAAEVYSGALKPLRRNLVYRSLPGDIRAFIRTALRNAIAGLVNGPLVDPILEIIGELAGGMDDLLDDIQQLNPNRPLDEQVLALLLDAIEDGVRDHFGGRDPSIRVGFDVAYEFYGPQHLRFELGAVTIPIRTFCNLLRDGLNGLSVLRRRADAMARQLSAAFEKQLHLDDLRAQADAAQAARARLEQLEREHAVSEKTVAIVNPQPGSVHDHRVSARIHLGGVPDSYLGLDRDEAQRVFVLLNGQQLSLKSIAVGDDPHDLRHALQGGDIRLADLGDLTPLKPAQVEGRGLIGRATASTSGRATTATSVLRSRGAQPVMTKHASDSGGKTSQVTRGSFTAILPGRRGRATEVTAWTDQAQAQHPGVTIAVELNETDLARGANALSVLVVDPGGKQYRDTVSFVFLPDEAPARVVDKAHPAPAVLPGGVLPGKVVKDRSRTTPHWMFDARTLARTKTANLAFTRTQAALNFKKR